MATSTKLVYLGPDFNIYVSDRKLSIINEIQIASSSTDKDKFTIIINGECGEPKKEWRYASKEVRSMKEAETVLKDVVDRLKRAGFADVPVE